MIKVCKQCNKKYSTRRKNQVCCSCVCADKLKSKKVKVHCCICGKEIERTPKNILNNVYCSHRCVGIGHSKLVKPKGKNHHSWKTNVSYRYVQCPKDYLSMSTEAGRVAEHRLIVAQAIGRPLLKKEAVHHVNEDKTDNRLENLELFETRAAHKAFHRNNLTAQPIWSGRGKDFYREKIEQGFTNKVHTRAVLVKCPKEFSEMSHSDGYVPRYRLIVAKALGRPLSKEESVHHIDRNNLNDDINNLELYKNHSDHMKVENGNKEVKPIWSSKCSA